MDYSRLIASTGLFASGMTAGECTLSYVSLDTNATCVGLTGVAAAYPLLINHFFIRSDQGLSLNQRLAIWHRSYTAGAGCIPFLALPSAASYITYALNYARTTGSKQALIGAAVLHLAIIPFTVSSGRGPGHRFHFLKMLFVELVSAAHLHRPNQQNPNRSP